MFPVNFHTKGLAAVLALIALATFGCARSPQAKSARYMAEGKKLLQKNDPTRAILQFRNAASLTPNDAEVLYQLSRAYLASGDIDNGVRFLRRTLQLDPKHRPAQLRMAELMSYSLDSGHLKDAQQRLKTLLETSPDDPDALHALALTELKLGEPDSAQQHLERAIAAAPQQLAIAATLAQTKLRQKDVKGAEEVLKKAIESSPKSAEALVLLGRFYASQHRAAEAQQQYRRAIAVDANHPTALVDLGTLENGMGAKGEAERIFKRVSLLSDKTANFMYGSFLFAEGRRDEAVREFERLAKQDPEDRLARTRLVSVYRAANRTQDAENVLNQALKKNSNDLDALLQRGEMSLSARKYDSAEADLNQVLRLQPNSADVYYVMAKLHQARGRDLTYRQDLAKSLQMNPYRLPVRVELSEALVLANSARTALDVLNQTPESQKQSIPVLVQRNWALWALGDMAAMRKSIDLGLSLQKTTDLLLQDGLWKLRTGNFTGARAAAEAALGIDPSDLRALRTLNVAYASQKQNSIAVQKIKEYAVRQPKSAPVQDFLGVLLLTNGDRQQARSAFEAAHTADPQFVKANLSLVQTDVIDGKFDDAQRRLESVIASDAANTTARLWLGHIQTMKGNQKGALEQYRQVVASEPNNAQALNNLAYLMAEVGQQPSEALKYAQKAKELVPDSPEYSDTLGWILYRQGLYPLAVQELERAAAKKGEPASKYHLAMAYAKAGDLRRGRATLETALKENPNLAEAKVAQEMLSRPEKGAPGRR